MGASGLFHSKSNVDGWVSGSAQHIWWWMAEIDPEQPFRSAARKLPLTCCTLLLEISLSAYGKL